MPRQGRHKSLGIHSGKRGKEKVTAGISAALLSLQRSTEREHWGTGAESHKEACSEAVNKMLGFKLGASS